MRFSPLRHLTPGAVRLPPGVGLTCSTKPWAHSVFRLPTYPAFPLRRQTQGGVRPAPRGRIVPQRLSQSSGGAYPHQWQTYPAQGRRGRRLSKKAQAGFLCGGRGPVHRRAAAHGDRRRSFLPESRIGYGQALVCLRSSPWSCVGLCGPGTGGNRRLQLNNREALGDRD